MALSPLGWLILTNLCGRARRSGGKPQPRELARILTPGQAAAIYLKALPIIQNEPEEQRRAIKSLILAHTNRRYVAQAKLIREKDPNLFEAVWKGNLSIPAAKRKLGLA